MRRPRALSPLREHLRDTFWFTPVLGLLGAALLAWGCAELDTLAVDALRASGDYESISDLLSFAEDAKAIVTTIGSAMLTFIGVVFSISLVALQMAAGQFSPRVVRLYVRSRITKATFTTFLATFLFALLVQVAYDDETDPRKVTTVLLFSGVAALTLLGVSLLLFVAYVNSTLRLMRVSYVVDRVARESLRVLGILSVAGRGRSGVRAGGEAGPEAAEEAALAPDIAEIAHSGRAGVLRDVHVARLIRVARRHGTVLRLIPQIGDFIVPGTPVLAVHGGRAPAARTLRFTVSVGVERTFHQDVGFGLRQLADIALRALSPAVNDPTTAVQCLDRIHQILTAAAHCPLGTLLHRDHQGAVRLIQRLPGWTELVDLGFTEIRGIAPGSPQVTRRLAAALDDLLDAVPEQRRAPMLRHHALLVQAVERTVREAADRAFALSADRQGIG
ncbi:DUF2254 domain-containing protein [Streptomyces sp. H27-D2]|uniref:DUF2254 domain-containing protein n=1 Tax=Streptomyces sp. H27-D2 TaxID=3046304 RepID=UPI002DBBD919|nr:DUF2254 domain-containing protein [Streptomyces sp. H27-D2]MEC4020703.1 DUF2254 domain-containing protein [Streptomyces sp. H27-D2]